MKAIGWRRPGSDLSGFVTKGLVRRNWTWLHARQDFRSFKGWTGFIAAHNRKYGESMNAFVVGDELWAFFEDDEPVEIVYSIIDTSYLAM